MTPAKRTQTRMGAVPFPVGSTGAAVRGGGALWFALGSRPQPQQNTGYLLKDNGGHLALYTADGTGPLAEYDIYTRLLPENDILALQEGVAVADEAELQQRLEDYGL